MLEIIKSLFKTTEERIKQPFTGAFVYSWIIFNWKPIAFFIFSSQIVEAKIEYIEFMFNDVFNLFVFPFLFAVFYVIGLPHISLAIDMLLRYSELKRTQLISKRKLEDIVHEKDLAIANIELEESKTEFRERKTHNKLVEDLQIQISKIQLEFQNERSYNNRYIDELKLEISQKDEFFRTEQVKNQEVLLQYQKTVSDLTTQLNSKAVEVLELNKKLQSELAADKIIGANIIEFVNGHKMYEFVRNDGTVTIHDYETGKKVSLRETAKYFDNHEYIKINLF